MAKNKSTYVPASYSGILRYKEELEKGKIVLEPRDVILLILGIAGILLILAKFGYFTI